MHGTINIKLTAYSCICWLFHSIYYDARNHKNKTLFSRLLHNSPALYIHCPLDDTLNWNCNLYMILQKKKTFKILSQPQISFSLLQCAQDRPSKFLAKGHKTVRHSLFYTQNISKELFSLCNSSSGPLRRQQEIKRQRTMGIKQEKGAKQ